MLHGVGIAFILVENELWNLGQLLLQLALIDGLAIKAVEMRWVHHGCTHGIVILKPCVHEWALLLRIWLQKTWCLCWLILLLSLRIELGNMALVELVLVEMILWLPLREPSVVMAAGVIALFLEVWLGQGIEFKLGLWFPQWKGCWILPINSNRGGTVRVWLTFAWLRLEAIWYIIWLLSLDAVHLILESAILRHPIIAHHIVTKLPKHAVALMLPAAWVGGSLEVLVKDNEVMGLFDIVPQIIVLE